MTRDFLRTMQPGATLRAPAFAWHIRHARVALVRPSLLSLT